MKITVFLLAFGIEVPIPERIVDLDGLEGEQSNEELLDLTFYYGQNDFQPQPQRSVSVGDVIKLPDGSLHKVLGSGFEALPAGTDINTLPRGRDAVFC